MKSSKKGTGHIPWVFTLFGILQKSNRYIKIYYLAMVKYMKVGFEDSLLHNNLKKETQNVNYKSIIDKFTTKINQKN